ncbi:class I SAM-dependent methyltransferase [Rhodoferax sp.]|uniref:class I SAM-dependent methyltransferase n=1 Tax=Rhodoferax sp. TaxID=50421 RepID=UPI00374D602B
MGSEIIGLHNWLDTPPGRYLLDWECGRFDQAVADVFGYHALQLGLPELPGLQNNRIPHRWLASAAIRAPLATASPGLDATLVTDFSALPFSESSLDLMLLPHALELSPDPHATLREVERVLVPEGRVVISGFNPMSLWGLRQSRGRLYRRLGVGDLYVPEVAHLIGYWRLRDWLRLLSFEVESVQFGCYRPSVRSEAWLNRFAWMDRVGERSLPILGAVYFVVAVKRVRGMRLLGPSWKAPKALANAPVPIANKGANKNGTSRDGQPDSQRKR